MIVNAWIKGRAGTDIQENIEIDDNLLKDLTKQERDEYIDELIQWWMLEQIEYGWKEIIK